MKAQEKSVYDFKVLDIDKKEVDLKKYEGKVLLIVNVARLEILGFPCNQFGSQEPGTNEEIKEFACGKYKVKFPMFDKIEVNGDNAAPLYKFLKSSLSFKFLISIERINWNFTKFLVDKSGVPHKRYEPTTEPNAIVDDILKLLKDEK
eukprot:gene377-6791_t